VPSSPPVLSPAVLSVPSSRVGPRRPEELSLAQARRVALRAQGLDRPRRGPTGMGGLQQVVDRLGLLQIDSVNVLARAHLMPTFSRIGPYDVGLLDRASGRAPRRLVECWAHEASLVPPATYRLLGWRQRASREHVWGGIADSPMQHAAIVGGIRELIRERGPVTAREVQAEYEAEHPRARGGKWWNWTVAKRALEFLFFTGEVTAARRNPAFERCYDLTERVLPPAVLALPEPSEHDAVRALVEIGARAHGIGTAGCFGDYFRLKGPRVARAVVEAAGRSEKPCAATFLGMVGVTEALSGGYRTDGGVVDNEAGDGNHEHADRPVRAPRRVVPAYPMPEDAVRALAAATRYGQWRARERGELVDPSGLDLDVADRLVESVLADAPEGRTLTAAEAEALLAAYGVRLWPTIPAATADEAVAAAEQIGYPVVIKSISPTVRHQPGQAAMHVDLGTESSVRDSFESLSVRLSPMDADTFVVQRMGTPGVACVVRTAEDPVFGPVVSFSIAGPPTDLLNDIVHRVPPLTDVDVSDLISSVKASPLLNGYHGAAVVDHGALADLIARVSVLADRHPDVASLEINPVLAHPGGVDVLGVEIEVIPSTKRVDDQRRALT